MISRLAFDLDAVCQLAEHAAAAATGTNHTGANQSGPGHFGPALLLRSGSNGIWLTSNAPSPQPAPATQPGTLDRRAAFADQCPPGTPWLEQVRLLRTEATPLIHVLLLDEPAGNPLLDQLRTAYLSGATTVMVLLSGPGLSVAVGRRRTRPTTGHTSPADRQDGAATAMRADQQHTDWRSLLRGYRTLPRYPRISELMMRIERLRDDSARLHDAHLTLVGFGVFAQRDEYLARTAAIEHEAQMISAELQTLGAHEAAQLARDGWTMTLTRHHASAHTSSS
jgi:hypothetical protein